MYQSAAGLRLATTGGFPGEFERQLIPMLPLPPDGNPLCSVGGTDKQGEAPVKALTLATLSALSMIAVGGAALAAGPGMGPMNCGPAAGPVKMFNDADTNKDGKLDAAEIAAARDKLYAEANPSGKDGIDIQDFETWFWKQHREMMVRAFQRLDADGDGKITKAEMEAAGQRMMSRLVHNDDGTYSLPSPSEHRGWGRDGKHGRHHGPGMMQRWMGRDAGPADAPPPAADEAPAPAN
jgi:hypothetical protein